MKENLEGKLLSEIGRYELININDGEKYDCLQNNDLIVDDEGNIKYLVVNISSSKLGLFSNSKEFLEIPWNCVKKIGARTIILDAEENEIKKTSL
ncbi:MAG: YlmC/YmxH family sporulation protein [Clostridium sp.]|uniref:YlmC/YmxH family sporulation protein n=1 Tax=Clostridium sp. DSM 8431 TaxID=1761781 RepID=UPI0008ED9DD5|nr:YlmC/YmxH family sporulation protein [Clostridium sp. DSM 8431]MCR4944437.1 YlmC/YmxH family sporulation protein [Clostridium sp.]SFU44212.1 sporulation protein, YlmC/YmxH family [Clostridium sp. DSM 8431]